MDQRDQDQIKLNSQLVQSMSELLQKYSDVVKENKQKEEEITKLRMEKTVLIDFSFDWNQEMEEELTNEKKKNVENLNASVLNTENQMTISDLNVCFEVIFMDIPQKQIQSLELMNDSLRELNTQNIQTIQILQEENKEFKATIDVLINDSL